MNKKELLSLVAMNILGFGSLLALLIVSLIHVL